MVTEPETPQTRAIIVQKRGGRERVEMILTPAWLASLPPPCFPAEGRLTNEAVAAAAEGENKTASLPGR